VTHQADAYLWFHKHEVTRSTSVAPLDELLPYTWESKRPSLLSEFTFGSLLSGGRYFRKALLSGNRKRYIKLVRLNTSSSVNVVYCCHMG